MSFFQDPPEIVSRNNHTHNHLPGSEVEKRQTKRKLKEVAMNSGAATRTVVQNACMGKDDEQLECLSNERSMKRLVQRARKDENEPKNPSQRTGFEIEGTYAEYDKRPFLRHDSGSDDEKRILIFVTDEGIRDLQTYKNWSGDGTFKSSPKIFYQVFLLHVHINATQTVPR